MADEPKLPATLNSIAVAIGVLQNQTENIADDVDELKDKFETEHEANSKTRTTVAVLKGQIGLSRWFMGCIGAATLGTIGTMVTVFVR